MTHLILQQKYIFIPVFFYSFHSHKLCKYIVLTTFSMLAVIVPPNSATPHLRSRLTPQFSNSTTPQIPNSNNFAIPQFRNLATSQIPNSALDSYRNPTTQQIRNSAIKQFRNKTNSHIIWWGPLQDYCCCYFTSNSTIFSGMSDFFSFKPYFFNSSFNVLGFS